MTWAKETPGAITGKLVDPDNRVVVTGVDGINVMLKNTTTGTIVASKITDGGYFMKDVPTGIYDVDIPIPCCTYARYQQKGLLIKPGETLHLDFHVGWGISIGTIGDDPIQLAADMRAKTKNPNAPAPRTADGKPDLSGVWTMMTDPTANRPPLPMQPWAAEMLQKLQQINKYNAGTFCMPQAAIPTLSGRHYKFIQTPKIIVQLTEYMTPGHRQIFMEGRKHPDLNEWNPAWYGHSIGYWEGDTLVVDTIGYNEVTPGFGVHSEKLHTIERYRRTHYGTLDIEVTADDSAAWTAPYHLRYAAGLAEGEEILEFVCAEDNELLHTESPWRGRP
ncbi:MAG: carboxypeptidase-like regulatory domain-containing protein [Steroidobacteraceae bacterium]